MLAVCESLVCVKASLCKKLVVCRSFCVKTSLLKKFAVCKSFSAKELTVCKSFLCANFVSQRSTGTYFVRGLQYKVVLGSALRKVVLGSTLGKLCSTK